MAFLELKNVNVKLNNELIVQDVSFSIERGDTLAVIGPNGAGKTTLLKAILGFLPSKGSIQWEKKPKIGYVPQKIDVERNLPVTVQEFLELAPSQQFSTKEVLEFVKLSPQILSQSLSNLSSGEFQRILIAFALQNHPDILLFDEPTASIDVGGQETIYELLHLLQDKQNFALLLISHDLTMVYRYANKVLCLNRKQVCFGNPKEVLSPEEIKNLYGGAAFDQHLQEKHS